MVRQIITRTCLGLAVSCAAVLPGLAAPPVGGYSGWAYSKVAGCPYLEWRLAVHPNGQVAGVVYYSDLSGISFADGNIDDSGKFHLTLVSARGNGPVGAVDGTRSKKGGIDAVLKGGGCANVAIKGIYIKELNSIPQGSSIGYNPPG